MNKQSLNEEGKSLWNKKAVFWDQLHGEEGNQFHRELVSPAVEVLVGDVKGKRVLDIACGSGQMARRLAALGAEVTAVDFSAALIKMAQKRGTPEGTPIEYRVVDATDEAALLALGENHYDLLVSTMALMDIPDLEPMFRAAYQNLKAEGIFVFATAHPAFFSNNTGYLSEMNEIDGQAVYTHSLKVTHYLELPPQKGVGAHNEPAPHYYYHRPLSELLDYGFRNGFVLDALREPGFAKTEPQNVRPLSWTAMWQIPPVIVGRFKKVNPP